MTIYAHSDLTGGNFMKSFMHSIELSQEDVRWLISELHRGNLPAPALRILRQVRGKAPKPAELHRGTTITELEEIVDNTLGGN